MYRIIVMRIWKQAWSWRPALAFAIPSNFYAPIFMHMFMPNMTSSLWHDAFEVMTGIGLSLYRRSLAL